MKYHKEKRCQYCNEWYVFDRSSHSYYCPNCARKPNTYLKQIRFQQKKLARKILEMVRNLSEQDIITFRNAEFENKHHCQHCNRVLPPDIDPVTTVSDETQNIPDPNFGRHRRKHH